MTVEIKINSFRLASSAPQERESLAFFNVLLPGVEIRRCRLIRCDGRIVVRGPMYDRRRNRASFGEINFEAATYRAITEQAVAIFYQMCGSRAGDEAVQPVVDDQPAASVLPFPPARAVAHG